MKKNSANYHHVVKPDYHIKIGIKKGVVVEVDFSEMHQHEKKYQARKPL